MANVALPTNAVDLEGLGDLRRRAQRDDPSASPDVAVQFEALFIGMMLESARSASLGSGLFDGGETEQYLALMDRQVALELARQGGFGFGKMLEQQLGGEVEPARALAMQGTRAPRAAELARAPQAPVVDPAAPPLAPSAPAEPDTSEFPVGLPSSLAALSGAHAVETPAEPTPAQFVTALLPEAQAAAAELGIEPRLLLAQAALETGWGRAVPQRGDESAQQSVRYQGRRVVVRRRRRAVDARARRRRDGAAARAIQSVRQHGRELRRLRRPDLRRRGATPMRSSSRQPRSVRARRDEGRLRDRSRSTPTSGSRSITAIASSTRCAASICRRRHLTNCIESSHGGHSEHRSVGAARAAASADDDGQQHREREHAGLQPPARRARRAAGGAPRHATSSAPASTSR